MLIARTPLQIKKLHERFVLIKEFYFRPYECPECQQRFTYNVVLKKHRQRDHNVQIEFMRKENPHAMPGKNSAACTIVPKIEAIKSDSSEAII